MYQTSCRFRFFYFLSLVAFSTPFLAQTAASAKDSAGATLSAESAALLAKATATYGLSGAGAAPWRLRVSFKLFDENGSPKDQGTYEELWVSERQYKRIYASTLFAQTEYRTEKGIFSVGSRTWPTVPLALLRPATLSPAASTTTICRLASNENMTLSIRQQEVGGTAAQCFELRRKQEPAPAPNVPMSDSCFDASGALARYSVETPGVVQATMKNPIQFQGRILPGDLVLDKNGTTVLSAHIDSVELLSGATDAEFQPPPEAVQPMITMVREKEAPSAGLPRPGNNISAEAAVEHILTRAAPVYPPIAWAARIQGTVVLQATISKGGLIEDLHVVSGPPLLLQSALEAVRQWTYRPFLLNGEPAEVRTTINVLFLLGKEPVSTPIK